MSKLFWASLFVATAVSPLSWSQSCESASGAICASPDEDTVVVMPVAANAGGGAGSALSARGFVISTNDGARPEDARLIDLQHQADLALASADIQVRFDGLGAQQRLDAQVIGPVPDAGDSLTFQSRTNYPAFVVRGDIRIIDPTHPAGPRTIRTVAVTPGGRVSVDMPTGDGLVYVHRVYDADGRYDETEPIPLNRRDIHSIAKSAEQEEGSASFGRQGIRITGGAITVSGSGLPGGTRVRTLGEVIKADASGRFVLQRILPVGDHAIEVVANTLDLTREVTVPGAEWFRVGIVDVTFGWREEGSRNSGGQDTGGSYDRGRIAGYVRGRLANGIEVTASVDSREEELRDIFRKLDRRDPKGLLRRLVTDEGYPTHGDGSTFKETAPTSGRMYVKVEKDGNHLLWGDYRAALNGTEYVRNERALYGAKGHWESQGVTAAGEARVSLDVHAAQPDNLPGRDVFRGTGGSIYFLSRQDIVRDSETLTIEIRDSQSSRSLDRKTLTKGRDYEINYIQGVVHLMKPLSAYAGGSNLIKTNPHGDDIVNLVAQYEWTPVGADVDGYVYGARAEAWPNETLRLGVSGLVEKTATADQVVPGVDLRWQHSDGTWFESEYAHSRGPGFSRVISTDGGLTGAVNTAQGGRGTAYRLRSEADLLELGRVTGGHVGGYFERRKAGFTSLDYVTTSDETLWGVYGEMQANDATRIKIHADLHEDDTGRKNNEVGLELPHRLSDQSELSFGTEYLDRETPGDTSEFGARTELALRYSRMPSTDRSWHVYAQSTVARTGELAANNRAGIGGELKLNERWSLESDVSEGNLGSGARALVNYDGKVNDSYFGYTLVPDRSLSDTTLKGRDHGQFVLGSTHKISDRLTGYSENSYDMFGKRRSLLATYGVDYSQSDFVDYTMAFEVGTIEDAVDGDFRHHALSVGYAYKRAITNVRTRVEYRRERGLEDTTTRNSDTVVFSGNVSHEYSEDSRILGGLELVYTDVQSQTLTDQEYAELSFGHVWRPVAHDRLNVLSRYRYVFDEYGQVINSGESSQTRGPLQHNHIFSADAEYDLNPRWSVGGKLGYRILESADPDAVTFSDNNAWLAVVNARHHVTHNWDFLTEARALGAEQADTIDYGFVAAVYRHVNKNFKVGIGYNFGSFSDDLADLTHDEKGLFLNLVAKF